MKLVIEHGIPFPKRYGRKWDAFFQKMQVGDSFLVPNFSERASISMAARRLGHAVTTAKQNNNGYRIWMVKKKEK